jgi:peptide chain release factor 1
MQRKLLFSLTKKDFETQTFRAGGPGGQYQNKVETAVRIIHPASGAVGESREQRTQLANRKIAFRRLVETPKFKTWHRLKVAEMLMGKTIEQIVNELMDPKNIKIEVKDDKGKWIEG